MSSPFPGVERGMAAAHSPRQARINSEAPGSVKRRRDLGHHPRTPDTGRVSVAGGSLRDETTQSLREPRRPRPDVTASDILMPMPEEPPKRLIVVGDRVLIAPEEGEERTNVGLYLPPTAVETRQVQGGRIVATGPGTPMTEPASMDRSEEHTSELQSQSNIVCR